MILYGSRIEGHYSLNTNTPQFRFNSDVKTNKRASGAHRTDLRQTLLMPKFTHTNSHLIFTGSDACTSNSNLKHTDIEERLWFDPEAELKTCCRTRPGENVCVIIHLHWLALRKTVFEAQGGALMQSWLCWGTSGRLGFWPPEETSAVPGWPWSDTGPSRPCQTCLLDWANRTTGVDTQGRASSQRRGWRASDIRPAGGRATGCWWCREAWWDPERLTEDRTGVDGASQPPEGLSLLSRRDEREVERENNI